MLLKVSEESSTGLNTKYVNAESGRTITLEHAIKQIEKQQGSDLVLSAQIQQLINECK